jgi:hypothetical protein
MHEGVAEFMSRFVHIAISILFVTFVLAVIAISFYGYVIAPSKVEWPGVTDKTFWHWLKLIVAPVLLSGGGFLLYTAWTWSGPRRAEKSAHEAARHANLNRIATAYIDDIEELLVKEELLLKADPNDGKQEASISKLSKIARARTLNVLEGLDGPRKDSIIRFLCEAGLFEQSEESTKLFIDLSGANLRGATEVAINALKQRAVPLEDATLPNGKKYKSPPAS